MFKNSILRYLNSAAVFAPDDAIAAQRAALQGQVTVGTRSENEGENNNDNNNNSNDENNNGEDNSEDEDGEDDNEEDDDEGSGGQNEPENETDEQKAARLAQEKEDRRQARIQKRIDKLTAQSRDKDAEIARLQAQLAEQPKEGLTEEEVSRRAQEEAQKIINQQNEENNKKQFEKDCENIQKAALKVDKDFNTKINNIAAEIAPIPAVMIGILTDLDNENGGEVLAKLADDADLYEEVIALPPGKMMLKLVRMSDRLKEATKKPVKPQSKVPAPITPINEGRTKKGDILPDKPNDPANIAEFVRIRNEQEAAKRKARGF